MGSVYRAEDTRLGREVAIKVLPPSFTEDEERLARFEREAQILATLNHPNIAAIYEVGNADDTRFLVMELAEGETLGERLERGSLSVAEALEVGRQIATALEAAHDKNVIHRDLKPANIKLTPDGRVKVLDFGLAKAWGPDSTDVSESPTLTAQMTQAGVILGTAAYMSPEQARGAEVDKRTDIWSFGCVLYESLTGRRSFAGETVTDILASVVKEEPDLALLPDAVPPRVVRLLSRCLQKNTNDRLRDIGDARIELTESPAAAPTIDVPTPPSSRSFSVREMAGWVLSLLLLAALGWLMFGDRGSTSAETSRSRDDVVRFRITEPAANLAYGAFNQSLLAISPDGRHVVYLATIDDTPRLMLRSISELDARPIPESELATDPFFSADGQSIGFFSEVGGALKTASLKSLLPTELAPIGNPRGGSWGDDGTIVYAPSFATGLMRFDLDTGESTQLTEPIEEDLERSHRWPHVLPGSRSALFTVITAQIASIDEAHLEAVDLESGERRTVLRNTSYARFLPPDRLLFMRSSHLLSVRFDPVTLETSGQPEVLLRDIASMPLSGAAAYDVSASGSLVYARGGPLTYRNRIWRYDRDGRGEPVSQRLEPFQSLRLSPDGRSLAVGIDSVNQAIWVLDLERDSILRITHAWGHNDPVWLPSQKALIATSGRRGTRNVHLAPVDGSGNSTPLTDGGLRKFGGTLTPDGKRLLFMRIGPAGNSDLWWQPVEGGPAEPLLETPFDETWPEISPDGQWIAYSSDESGRQEIYIVGIDGRSDKTRVSRSGGAFPRWTRDARSLLYIEPGPPAWLARVPVARSDGLEIGRSERLLELQDSEVGPRMFDTTPDGGFFLLRDETPDSSSIPLIVVRNWAAELESL